MLGELRFAGAWRHYQELALDAFEARPRGGPPQHASRRAARLGQDAARLRDRCAGSARRRSCSRRTRRSRPSGCAGAAFGAPAGLVAGRARRRRRVPHLPGARAARRPGRRAARRRRRRAGRRSAPRRPAQPADGGRRRGRALDGRGRAPARARARPHHRVAQARDRARRRPGVRLADLLAPGARERVDALRAGGVATVVLDECHHLASLWGYVVRAVLEELAATSTSSGSPRRRRTS